jgi:hypothetical protein
MDRAETASGSFWTQLDPKSWYTDSIGGLWFTLSNRARRMATPTAIWLSALRVSVGSTNAPKPKCLAR